MQNFNELNEIKIIDTENYNFSAWVDPSNKKPKALLFNLYQDHMEIFKNLYLIPSTDSKYLFHIIYQEKNLKNLKTKTFPFFDLQYINSDILKDFWHKEFDQNSEESKYIQNNILKVFDKIAKEVKDIRNYLPISQNIKTGFGLFQNSENKTYVFSPNHNLTYSNHGIRPIRTIDFIDYDQYFENQYYKQAVFDGVEKSTRLTFNMIDNDSVILMNINKNGEGVFIIYENDQNLKNSENTEEKKRGSFLNQKNYHSFSISKNITDSLFNQSEEQIKIFLEDYFWLHINPKIDNSFICMEHYNLEDQPIHWEKGSEETLKKALEALYWSKHTEKSHYPIQIIGYTQSDFDDFQILTAESTKEDLEEEYKYIIKDKFLAKGYNYISHIYDQIGFRESHYKQKRIMFDFQIHKPNRYNIIDSKLFIKKIKENGS